MALGKEYAYPAARDNFCECEKLFAKKMLKMFAIDDDLDKQIARFYNIYGPQGAYKSGREKSPAA